MHGVMGLLFVTGQHHRHCATAVAYISLKDVRRSCSAKIKHACVYSVSQYVYMSTYTYVRTASGTGRDDEEVQADTIHA